MKNYYIIGAGLSGAVAARILADKGHKVTIIEKRKDIAGNLLDDFNCQGFYVQKYGPHVFHTSNEKVWEFINRFSSWKEYRLICGAYFDGVCTPTPFNFKTIDDYYIKEKAEKIKKALKDTYPDRDTITVLEALNSDNELVCEYADFLFCNDYSLYTAKQWNVSCNDIDKSVLERVPLRLSYEEGYFSDKYQVMPENGYKAFIENILNHENITVKLETDAKDVIKISGNKILLKDNTSDITVVYTGPIDELFNYSHGPLPYRSLKFKYVFDDKIDSYQKYPIVAYPKAAGYTRITEYSKMPYPKNTGTVYAVEYPTEYIPDITESYYPVLTDKSQNIYMKYREMAENIENLVLCGRLSDFKYYNMDQAIDRVLNVFEKD